MRKSIFISSCILSLVVGCTDNKNNYVPINTELLPSIGGIVSGSIAIDLKDEMTSKDIDDMSKEYGFIIRDSSPISHSIGNLEIADVDPEQENAILNKLSHDLRVEVAEPIIIFKTSFEPNDEMYKNQWGMYTIKAVKSSDYALANSVICAVIDTGIDRTLSDLKDNIFVQGYNFVDGNDNYLDRNSHGSHVSGTISQTTNNKIGTIGASPGVKLMAVKVLSNSGSGTNEGVASGIMFAVNNGANIINMSLGSSQKSAIVAKAVRYAYDHGVFVAVAAGNDASKISGSPASDFGAFAVSATDQKNNLASFSSFGKEVKLGAPGVDILQQTVSRDGKGTPVFSSYSGSSMSAPAVAAGGNLMYSQGITDPDSALKALQSSAIEKQDRDKFGAGILDIGSATRHTFFNHFLLRSLFLALFSFGLLTVFKKNKLSLIPGTPLYAASVATLFSSVGLFFFLYPLGLLPYLGSNRWIGELLARPFSEWDLLLNVSYHKWLPLASVFPSFAIVATGFHRPLLRGLAGGMALGVAAYLAQVAYSSEIQFIFGSLLMRVWAVCNIVVCLWIAKNTLAK